MFDTFSAVLDMKCQEDSSTDLPSPCRTYILFLKSCLVNTPHLLLPALNKLVRIALRAPSISAKAVTNISDLLNYTTPCALFSSFSEPLLTTWLQEGKELRHFPASAFSFTSLLELYREQISVISLTLILEKISACPII